MLMRPDVIHEDFVTITHVEGRHEVISVFHVERYPDTEPKRLTDYKCDLIARGIPYLERTNDVQSLFEARDAMQNTNENPLDWPELHAYRARRDASEVK